MSHYDEYFEKWVLHLIRHYQFHIDFKPDGIKAYKPLPLNDVPAAEGEPWFRCGHCTDPACVEALAQLHEAYQRTIPK